MGNLELDNQIKEQAVKFGDFERSYEGEIQHLEGEWNTAATTREGAKRASPGTEGRWLKSGYDGWKWWENCSGAWGGQYEAKPERTNLGGKNPSHGDCRWISFISTLSMYFYDIFYCIYLNLNLLLQAHFENGWSRFTHQFPGWAFLSSTSQERHSSARLLTT